VAVSHTSYAISSCMILFYFINRLFFRTIFPFGINRRNITFVIFIVLDAPNPVWDDMSNDQSYAGFNTQSDNMFADNLYTNILPTIYAPSQYDSGIDWDYNEDVSTILSASRRIITFIGYKYYLLYRRWNIFSF